MRTFAQFRIKYIQQKVSAFTLMELLAVIVIIAVIGSFAVPALRKVVQASELTQTAQTVIEQLGIIRQRAIARGKNHQVRFYNFVDKSMSSSSASYHRALLVFEQQDDGTWNPITKLYKFPVSVFMDKGKASDSASLTTILFPSNGAKSRSLQGSNTLTKETSQILSVVKTGSSYYYIPITFRPSGSTDLDKSATWFLTLRPLLPNSANPETNLAKVPNYITIQIDPYTGVSRYFRP